MLTETTPPEGFEPFGLPDHGLEVYAIGPPNRPGVVLLHELGGMSPDCIRLARDLAEPADGSAFRVYLPVLFGKPNQRKMLGADLRGLFCMRREMHYLASRETSPVTTRIRRLVADVAVATGIPSVGVIGMCLTGNLVFGLMAESTVKAAVSSQPSLPFPILWRFTPRFKRAALSVRDGDLIEAVRSRTPLLALRFENDWICPRERVESLRDAFEGTDRLTVERLPGSGHSVLTAHRTSANDRLPLVRKFLVDNLETDPAL